MSNGDRQHGNGRPLVSEATVKTLWRVLVSALALLVAADLFVEHHPSFSIDATFAFGAWMGLAACAGTVAVALGVGALLRRPEDYYDN